MRKLFLLPAVVLGVAALLFVLMSGDDPAEVVDQTGGHEQVMLDDEAVQPDLDPPAADSAREAVVAAAAVAAPDAGPPESYLKALSGLIGRLVEPDGTPVPGMTIEALAATLDDFIPEIGSLFGEEPPEFDEVKGVTETDEEGRFRFAELDPRGFYLLGIDFGGPRATFRFVDKAPNPGQVVDLGDVVLDPYVVFTGRVVDDRMNPVPGARIRATNLPSIIFTFGVQNIRSGFTVAFQEDLKEGWRVAPIPSWLPRLIDRFPVPQTRSEDDGTFRLEGVPLGMVTVLVDKKDLVFLVHGPVPSGDAGERHIGDLVLSSGEVLVGRVVDVDDEPIAGVEIIAGAQLELAPVAIMAPAAITDSEGVFRVPGLVDVEHVVAARVEDGVDWTLETDIVPGFDEPVIRIGDTHQITIIARDDAGEVIRKPSVVVRPINRIPLHPLLVAPISLAKRLSYRDDGAAVVTGLDPAKYSVLAKADGFAIGKGMGDVTLGPATVDIVLERELSALVNVIEAGSGEPVHFALAGVFDPNARREMRRVPLVTVRTTEDGVANLSGLKAGAYQVAVFHPAYATSFADIDVPGEMTVVELLQGGTLQGRVHASGEVPEEPRFIAMGKRSRGNFPRMNVTDENGEFEITHLEPGDYSIVVMRRFADKSLGDQITGGFEQYFPERFLEATIVEGEVTFLDIDILGSELDGPTATLRGMVVLNSAAGSDLTVQTRARGQWRSMKSAVTDRNGTFDFGQVPAGENVVSVRQKGRAGTFMFGRLAEQSFDLEANEVRDIRFDIRTGSVAGRVTVDRDGSPVVGAEVELRVDDDDDEGGPSARLNSVTGRDGRFSFSMVPAGTYRVRVRRDGYAPAVVPGINVPFGGAPPPVDVRLSGGVIVSGKVILPAELEETRFVYVNFRLKENRDVRAGDRVNLDTMEYAVDGLPPGLYEVEFYAGRSTRLEPLTVDVPGGGLDGYILSPQLATEEKK